MHNETRKLVDLHVSWSFGVRKPEEQNLVSLFVLTALERSQKGLRSLVRSLTQVNPTDQLTLSGREQRTGSEVSLASIIIGRQIDLRNTQNE